MYQGSQSPHCQMHTNADDNINTQVESILQNLREDEVMQKRRLENKRLMSSAQGGKRIEGVKRVLGEIYEARSGTQIKYLTQNVDANKVLDKPLFESKNTLHEIAQLRVQHHLQQGNIIKESSGTSMKRAFSVPKIEEESIQSNAFQQRNAAALDLIQYSKKYQLYKKKFKSDFAEKIPTQLNSRWQGAPFEQKNELFKQRAPSPRPTQQQSLSTLQKLEVHLLKKFRNIQRQNSERKEYDQLMHLGRQYYDPDIFEERMRQNKISAQYQNILSPEKKILPAKQHNTQEGQMLDRKQQEINAKHNKILQKWKNTINSKPIDDDQKNQGRSQNLPKHPEIEAQQQDTRGQVEKSQQKWPSLQFFQRTFTVKMDEPDSQHFANRSRNHSEHSLQLMPEPNQQQQRVATIASIEPSSRQITTESLKQHKHVLKQEQQEDDIEKENSLQELAQKVFLQLTRGSDVKSQSQVVSTTTNIMQKHFMQLLQEKEEREWQSRLQKQQKRQAVYFKVTKRFGLLNRFEKQKENLMRLREAQQQCEKVFENLKKEGFVAAPTLSDVLTATPSLAQTQYIKSNAQTSRSAATAGTGGRFGRQTRTKFDQSAFDSARDAQSLSVVPIESATDGQKKQQSEVRCNSVATNRDRSHSPSVVNTVNNKIQQQFFASPPTLQNTDVLVPFGSHRSKGMLASELKIAHSSPVKIKQTKKAFQQRQLSPEIHSNSVKNQDLKHNCRTLYEEISRFQDKSQKQSQRSNAHIRQQTSHLAKRLREWEKKLDEADEHLDKHVARTILEDYELVGGSYIYKYAK